MASLAMLAFATAAIAACAPADTPMSPGTHLAFGQWGANAAQVVASDSLTYVWLNCSFGNFAGNVALDANGRFTVDGNWTRSFGPIQLGSSMPAQLSGQVSGTTLTFAVAVSDTARKQVLSLGPQAVVFGRPTTWPPCPL